MKVEFAPLNIPLARRLQTASVLQWVLSFLLLTQLCYGIMIMLIIYNYWFLYIPYLIWLYFDWRVPEQGGRRSNWVRSWTVWRYFKDYFPIHLIKTQDLDPGQNYIFAFHPHGILVPGAFGNFATNYSDFKKLFPGFTAYLHVISCWFRTPFFRDYLMSFGIVSVSKKSLSHVLSKNGVNNPEGSWIRAAQDTLLKYTGLPLPLFHARGIFQYSFGIMPYRKPIHTIVGRPIPVQRTLHPTPEQTEKLHQTYMEELRKLFNEHKGKYGIPEHETLPPELNCMALCWSPVPAAPGRESGEEGFAGSKLSSLQACANIK
ncbi:hypothetical protein A6R68_16681 [Neotoma lepida]|uniref:Acyltransferase n=1 Tax=Neotoma lepida TaxID=56216 RepID=A0A1A6HGT7_NEOLE|nr:hypothetical protein A6R68_16681 [Neotoma lepida]